MFQPAATSTICPLCNANLAPLSEPHSPYIPCCHVSPCGGDSGCGVDGGGPLTVSLSLLFFVSPSPSLSVFFLVFFLCVFLAISLSSSAVVLVLELFTLSLLLSCSLYFSFFPYPLFFLLVAVLHTCYRVGIGVVVVVEGGGVVVEVVVEIRVVVKVMVWVVPGGKGGFQYIPAVQRESEKKVERVRTFLK